MQSVSAYDMKLSQISLPQIRFNIPSIDHVVGSIRFGGITEISGEAGCGKSQICLFLALKCSLNIEFGGVNGSTAYFNCGEGEFPVRRLSQMANAMSEKINNEASSGIITDNNTDTIATPILPGALMEKVFIERIDNFEQLLESVVSDSLVLFS